MGFIDFVGIATAVFVAGIAREVCLAFYVGWRAKRRRSLQIAELQDYARKLASQPAHAEHAAVETEAE